MVIFLILILIEGVTNSILADEVADTYKTLDIYISAIGNDEKNGDIENPINTLKQKPGKPNQTISLYAEYPNRKDKNKGCDNPESQLTNSLMSF